jgi:hypothetical protein
VRAPSQEPPDEATGASFEVVGTLGVAESVCVEPSSVAVAVEPEASVDESVIAVASTVASVPAEADAETVVACCAPVAARTATTPVVSAAAAAVAWVILTMRRLAALRFARDEPAPVAGGASL